MGGSSSNTFSSYNWQFVNKPYNYDIEQDAVTGIHAEKHIIPNNPKISSDNQMEVYRYRNLTNKPIVKVYSAQYAKNKGGGGCGAAKDIVVHSEYIPFRLSDIKNLTHGQALYVLSESLAGFQQLHYRFGPFQITDNHIGFNEIGQCKVWHSPNFATNHLNLDSIVLMSTINPKNFDDRMEQRQQEEMVEDIWMAVDQHASITPQFTSVANYFKERSFLDARKLVSDQIFRGQTYVPDHLNFGDQSQRITQNPSNYNTSIMNPVATNNQNQVLSPNQMVTSTVNNYQPPNTNTQSRSYQNLGAQTPVNSNNGYFQQTGNSSPYQSNPGVSQGNQNGSIVNYAQ